MNPDPLHFEEPTLRERGWAYAQLVSDRQRRSRSIPRWYLLASFVTGLLLGAAVARVVGL